MVFSEWLRSCVSPKELATILEKDVEFNAVKLVRCRVFDHDERIMGRLGQPHDHVFDRDCGGNLNRVARRFQAIKFGEILDELFSNEV